MITLNITYADGKHYWTEYFNSMDECTKWLSEEETRPYWQKDFVTEIIDKTQEVQDQLDAAKAKREQAASAKILLATEIKSDLANNPSTPEEVAQILNKMATYIGL